jgi:hypothetical protein
MSVPIYVEEVHGVALRSRRTLCEAVGRKAAQGGAVRRLI